MDLGITDRVALVAGASEGIGFGAALCLAREGARVVVASRDRARIETAAQSIRSETGGEAVGVVVDVTEPDCGERLVAAGRAAFGDPSILVTNAGGPAGGFYDSLQPLDFEAAVNLSFMSVVRLTHAALPAMRAAKWGRIVHISSATVIEPNPDLFLSSTVRPAVAGFSKSLAREMAPEGVTSNLVCPGYVATERLNELADRRARNDGSSREEALDAMAATVPMGRLATEAELGDAVAFLCSERAAYITGIALRVDGGKVNFML